MFYWVYDLPTWLFCLLTVGVCVVFSIAGYTVVNPWARRRAADPDMHNNLVSFFISAAGVFYGITLGLIAVGTWQSFADTDTRVSSEAASLGAIYRDVSTFPEPERSDLRRTLREYADFVIDRAWAEQRRGRVPAGANEILDRFQDRLTAFEPSTHRHEVLLAETLRQYNNLIECRRQRLQAVTGGMPATLWIVVFAGGGLTIAMTWLLVYERRSVLLTLIVLLAALVGLLIFLTAAMDQPLRGALSVGPDAFELVRDQLMEK